LETVELYRGGKSVEEIAAIRGITPSTVESHVAKAVAAGVLTVDPREYFSEDEEARLATAAKQHGTDALKPIFTALEETGNPMSYDVIRMFVAIQTSTSD